MTTEKKLKNMKSFGAGEDVPRDQRLQRIVDNFGMGVFKRHMFICGGPNCCTSEEGQKSWDYLKTRVKELWPDMGEAALYRTQVKCFRVCCEGPIAVVYPDGIWYRGVTPEVCELILQEHIIGGQVVEEHCFNRHVPECDGASD
jgi:(2Fe-2S) ferredoxin